MGVSNFENFGLYMHLCEFNFANNFFCTKISFRASVVMSEKEILWLIECTHDILTSLWTAGEC